MKERPILMSGEMVRALLSGKKTQTRRMLKVQPLDVLTNRPPWELKNTRMLNGCRCWFALMTQNPNTGLAFRCRHGEVGDRLWIKETFQPIQLASEVTQWRYRATDEKGLAPWKPSIFMPRKASRINLEILKVKVQRLHDMTDSDAVAEGIGSAMDRLCTNYHGKWINLYRELWERINGKASWDKNPWVWVIEFKRCLNEMKEQV